ncbi:hypothetical protein FBU59_000073 [Linderina macrospora]|uniref:Uncharacterized protein n=1 Tax=Linderina macrospora TaxID=4868 RepID=A0ACC1JI77_9FUNG|nr:hypothetical protein FBU59_000073 [Linderina macrospora]
MRFVSLIGLGLSALSVSLALPADNDANTYSYGHGHGHGHGHDHRKNFSLRVIHTNDVHAHYDQFNRYGSDCTATDISRGTCYGGAARQVTLINKLRAGHPNTLLFDAGDQAQGTLFYTIDKFNATYKIMNKLKYDAMTIGNHEFDDGPNFVAKFFNLLNFPVVCANMDTSKNPALAKVVKPYTIIHKYQLGVIGYITNTTGSISSSGPTVSFTDPAVAVNKYVKILRKKGIKRIIAVSHNGYKEDQDVAARTHGLDLIVGGHSHTYLSLNASEPGAGGLYPTAVKNLDGKSTYVLQAKAWGEYVGYVDIEFKKDGSIAKLSGEPVHLTQDIAQDTAMAAQVAEWRKPYEAYGSIVVGNLTTSISNSGCQTGECAIGDLSADAMLWARNRDTPVDIAIINSGGIRAGMANGTIRVRDVLLVFPFGNALVDITLTGAKLRETITGILAKKNVANGLPVTSFLQIAGARISYHLTADGAKALDKLEVKSGNEWVPVDDAKTYKIVTLDFIARGGDNFLSPAIDAPALITMEAALEDYFRAFSPVTAQLDGRIKDTTAA